MTAWGERAERLRDTCEPSESAAAWPLGMRGQSDPQTGVLPQKYHRRDLWREVPMGPNIADIIRHPVSLAREATRPQASSRQCPIAATPTE